MTDNGALTDTARRSRHHDRLEPADAPRIQQGEGAGLSNRLLDEIGAWPSLREALHKGRRK